MKFPGAMFAHRYSQKIGAGTILVTKPTYSS